MTDEPKKIVEPTQLKRFTMIRVLGDATPGKTKYAKPTELVHVVFHVDAIAQDESPDGVYPRLMGEFRATNLLTGDLFKAANAVFPTVLSDIIEVAKGDAAPNITGEYVIGAGPTGVYVKPVIEAARRNVIDLLLGWWADDLAQQAAKAAGEVQDGDKAA